MTIEAKIIADSVSLRGKRITTFQLRYPRFIHAEFMTHRMFSRNASSSRAIPIKTALRKIKEDMAYPIEFRSNKTGMQAGDKLSPFRQKLCKVAWNLCGRVASGFGWVLHKLGAHKQYANRITEPWSHISVVVTSTEWANFFALRYHSMAQPEICELARKMWIGHRVSKPTPISIGFWHLPYVPKEEQDEYFATLGDGCVGSFNIKSWMPLIKRSVARCARVSYLRHDGQKSSHSQDYTLYDRLLAEQPIHASPAEHQATPFLDEKESSGNLFGWEQFRKTLDYENITKFVGPIG